MKNSRTKAETTTSSQHDAKLPVSRLLPSDEEITNAANNHNAEFELSQIRKKSEHFEKALKTIRDAFYTDGETDKEKIDDLKAIAFNALYEIEQGLF